MNGRISKSMRKAAKIYLAEDYQASGIMEDFRTVYRRTKKKYIRGSKSFQLQHRNRIKSMLNETAAGQQPAN